MKVWFIVFWLNVFELWQYVFYMWRQTEIEWLIPKLSFWHCLKIINKVILNRPSSTPFCQVCTCQPSSLFGKYSKVLLFENCFYSFMHLPPSCWSIWNKNQSVSQLRINTIHDLKCRLEPKIHSLPPWAWIHQGFFLWQLSSQQACWQFHDRDNGVTY